jgi:hypothetical protein
MIVVKGLILLDRIAESPKDAELDLLAIQLGQGLVRLLIETMLKNDQFTFDIWNSPLFHIFMDLEILYQRNIGFQLQLITIYRMLLSLIRYIPDQIPAHYLQTHKTQQQTQLTFQQLITERLNKELSSLKIRLNTSTSQTRQQDIRLLRQLTQHGGILQKYVKDRDKTLLKHIRYAAIVQTIAAHHPNVTLDKFRDTFLFTAMSFPLLSDQPITIAMLELPSTMPYSKKYNALFQAYQRMKKVKQQSITAVVQSQSSTTAVLFVDNETRNFKGADKLGIETLLVDDTIPNSLLKITKQEYDLMVTFRPQDAIKLYKERYQKAYINAYGKMKSIQQYQLLNQQESKPLPMPCMGITDENIQFIKRWCEKNKANKKILLLDWDRTLSVLEGGVEINDDFTIPGKNLEAYTTFLLGGPDRLQKIQALLADMHSNGVDVFILTNSGWCQKDNKDLTEQKLYKVFKQIIQQVDPRIDDEHMLCSQDAYGDRQYSNKMLFLKNKWNLVEKV